MRMSIKSCTKQKYNDGMKHEKISYVVIVYGVDVETKSLDSISYCYYVTVDANS